MRASLRTKIYLSMLAMVTVSFAVTFTLTIYDQYEHNDEDNERHFLDKEEAIKASMEYFVTQNGATFHLILLFLFSVIKCAN